MKIALEWVTCGLCGSNNNNLLFQARDYRYGHSEMFNIVKCKSCGLIYLNPRPTAESVFEQYKEDYAPQDEKLDNLNRSRVILKKILGSFWYKIGGLTDVNYFLLQRQCELLSVTRSSYYDQPDKDDRYNQVSRY